jgi:putative oxidoreductase
MTALKHRLASFALAPDVGLFLIRAVLALVFVFHGAQKLFGWFGGHGIEGTAQWMASIGIPFPTLSVVLAGSTELFGGLALLAGGLVGRLATAPMAFTMLVAVLSAHRDAFDAAQGGMEYALTLGVVLAGLGLIGMGRLGVPALVARLRGEAAAPAPVAPEAVTAR